MAAGNLTRNNHLLWRSSFGPALNQIHTLADNSQNRIWEQIILDRAFKPIKLETAEAVTDYKSLANDNVEKRKQLMQMNRKQNIEINLKFLNEMVNSEDQLREKMAFFWHGHFATRVVNAQYNEHLINILREKALGSFSDLLLAVSQSPAMLQFLNNQQNKKGHPNENFARKVMELFTMGCGYYTENDVREAARSFTGW